MHSLASKLSYEVKPKKPLLKAYELLKSILFNPTQNQPDLLLPLLTFLALFIITLACSPIFLIIYCTLANIEHSFGECTLSIILTFGFIYSVIWVTGKFTFHLNTKPKKYVSIL